jgi:hypothetical protein
MRSFWHIDECRRKRIRVHLVGLISCASEMNDGFGLDRIIECPAITCCRPLEPNSKCEIDLIDHNMAVDMPW